MTAIESVKPDLPFKPDVGESHAAFEAFLCFFDIGRNRSCVEVARRMGVTADAVRRWSSKFKWKSRIAAYHEQLLRAQVELDVAAKRDVASLWAARAQGFKEQEWAAAEKLLAVAHQVLASFAHRDPDEITLSEVSRALEVASKLGRLATGLATDHQEHSGPGGGPIQLEVAAALKKIYGRPLPGEVVEVEEVQTTPIGHQPSGAPPNPVPTLPGGPA
jgi:hypothetical protein